MKNTSCQISFLIPLLFLVGNCYAAIDSLPGCINTLKIATESSVTEYEYKGQRWFVFTKIIPPPEDKVSDKMTTTKFYNADCKIVCWWTKGGIAGLNRVRPDSVEKSKIKKLDQPTKYPKTRSDTALGDTIRQLANQLNARYVQQYDYNGQPVYFLAIITFPAYELAKKGIPVIEEKYYNGSGKWVASFRRATAGMYMRAQRWEPASFVPSNLLKTKKKWIKTNDGYIADMIY